MPFNPVNNLYNGQRQRQVLLVKCALTAIFRCHLLASGEVEQNAVSWWWKVFAFLRH